ncbi:MAG: protein kinase [Gammaproteobacteria bacterium]
MSDHLNALPVGYRLEEYEIVRVLGAGGFGMTYLAFDHHLDHAVAVKEYLPNDLAVRASGQTVVAKSTQDRESFEWGLERFLDEARTLARFSHPNLIRVHRFFRAHGTGYIVMEYAEGETLTEVLKRRGRMSEGEWKGWLLPMLEGLSQVHAASYLHRDIKPGNIIIRLDGSPVLIDFGAARQAVGAKSRSVTSIVTPGYAPIEQYSSRGKQGAWTDIYALGAVSYRVLTGEEPADATERVREDPLVPAVEAGKGQGSEGFLRAIDWALSVDEKDRPQTVGAWRMAVAHGAVYSGAVPGMRESPESKNVGTSSMSRNGHVSRKEIRSTSRSGFSWKLAIAITTVAAIGVGLLAYSWKPNNGRSPANEGRSGLAGMFATGDSDGDVGPGVMRELGGHAVYYPGTRRKGERDAGHPTAAQEEAHERARAQAKAETEALATAEPARHSEEEARSRPSHFLGDAGGGVLLQPSRGLAWTQSDNGSSITWDAASAYCAAKGGGWRLPTTAELLSLMGGEGTLCGGVTCGVSSLFRLTSYWFWSNEMSGSSGAWGVRLRSGARASHHRSLDDDKRALCVRPS